MAGATRIDSSPPAAPAPPLAIAGDSAANPVSGAGQYDVSPNGTGTLAYLSGRPSYAAYPLVSMNAAGETETLVATPRLYLGPRLSPDGRMRAVSAGGIQGADLYTFDLTRHTESQLTFNNQSNPAPVWTPDSKHLVYTSHPENRNVLWWARADGAGQPRKLMESADLLYPGSFSPDGRRLAYYTVVSGTAGDIWTLPLDLTDSENPQPGKPEVFLQTPKAESTPEFSPDGRWIAYAAEDTGRFEIYVRPFAGSGGKWAISSEGSQYCAWSRGIRQLFYSASNGQLMVVDYEVRGDSFVAGKPRPWALGRHVILSYARSFDVALDGKHVIGAISGESAGARTGNLHVTFLVNFLDELQRRLP